MILSILLGLAFFALGYIVGYADCYRSGPWHPDE